MELFSGDLSVGMNVAWKNNGMLRITLHGPGLAHAGARLR